MLHLEDIAFFYEPGHPVLENICFHILAGERVGLIGPNGAGKSTLMKILLGLLACEGEARVAGLPLKKQNLAAIRQKVGYLLQNSDNQLFMPTVYEDMMFAPLNYGLSRPQAEERVDRALSQLGLSGLKHRYNHQISGGEKRMAAIATILAMQPEILLMDEPSAALDPYHRRRVIQAICALPQTMLIASHDLDMILDTCGRVLLLDGGHIAAEGPAKEILTNRDLLESHRLELPLCLAGHHPGAAKRAD